MSAATPLAEPGNAPARLGSEADLRGLLVTLVKLALVDEDGEVAAWHTDATQAQRNLAGAANEVAKLRLDDLWAAVVKRAERDPIVRRDETVNPMLSTMSPLRLDQLSATPVRSRRGRAGDPGRGVLWLKFHRTRHSGAKTQKCVTGKALKCSHAEADDHA